MTVGLSLVGWLVGIPAFFVGSFVLGMVVGSYLDWRDRP